MRVADYIFERLIEVGLTHTYSVTGRGALFLTDAVAKNSEIINVSMHHEQAAGYAAVAHSQYTNQISMCLVSTGCASTNAMTPVLSAWQDGIPTFFLSGQNTLSETSRFTKIPIRTFGQQEADIVSLVENITKYAVMLEDPELIGLEMDKLIASATSGRKGPVWLDVPLDIQSMQINPVTLKRLPVSQDQKVSKKNKDVEKVISWLKEAKSPLLLLGHGTRSAGAIAELRSLISQTGIPLIFTASAVDIIGSGNEGSIGSIGMMGCSRSAAHALQEADLVIILGSRMNSMITGPNYDDFARKSKVVLVDIDAIEHSKPGRKYDLHLEVDIKYFLRELNSKLVFNASYAWKDYCETLRLQNSKLEEFMSGEDGVDLYQMAQIFSQNLPDEGILVTDSGFIELILPTNINFKNGQRNLHPISQGAMGYALPAAIGAHYASGRKVFGVVGDGSIMMNIQEFQTISHNNIPVVIIVMNNNAYAIIRKRQVELFRGRTIGTDNSNGLSCPNFEAVAKCFNIQYLKASTVEEFESAFERTKTLDGPLLIEVQGVSNQEYIQMARSKNSDGKLVQMPIENQFPFVVSAGHKVKPSSIIMEKK